jgi:hypothetical protein
MMMQDIRSEVNEKVIASQLETRKHVLTHWIKDGKLPCDV